MWEAYEYGRPGPTKPLLLALALHADLTSKGLAYPGAGELARNLGLGVRTVRRLLAQLVRNGEIQVVKRGGGRRHATVYRLTVGLGNSGTSDTVSDEKEWRTDHRLRGATDGETVSLTTGNSGPTYPLLRKKGASETRQRASQTTPGADAPPSQRHPEGETSRTDGRARDLIDRWSPGLIRETLLTKRPEDVDGQADGYRELATGVLDGSIPQEVLGQPLLTPEEEQTILEGWCL